MLFLEAIPGPLCQLRDRFPHTDRWKRGRTEQTDSQNECVILWVALMNLLPPRVLPFMENEQVELIINLFLCLGPLRQSKEACGPRFRIMYLNALNK